MIVNRNNHVFKGHKTLLGARYVTYGEVELPLRYDVFAQSKSGFDWGYHGSGAIQLAFSMLYQLSNEEFAKAHASQFASDVVKHFNARDWVLSAVDVLKWIKEHTKEEEKELSSPAQESKPHTSSLKKSKEEKPNVVKEVCRELGITQKQLAEILEIPEGTVSSWAVKNEIPRLGKKAIEFYIQNQKNQEIVESYKKFLSLLNAVDAS
jgi:DNA-binding transcriptional regulator YiaG